MLGEVLETLVTGFETGAARETIERALVTSNLLRLGDEMGGPPAPLAKRVKTLPRSRANEGAVLSAVAQGRVTLSRLYEDRRRRADFVLGVSLVLAGAFAATLIVGMGVSIWRNADIGGLQVMAALSPGFLSGGVFWLYSRERADLRRIERDLASLEALEHRMQIIMAIEDSEARNAALAAILRLMERPD